MVERPRNGPVFSVRRTVVVVILASLVTITDMFVFHLAGIATTAELITQTIILGLGLYIAYTVTAVFGTRIRL